MIRREIALQASVPVPTVTLFAVVVVLAVHSLAAIGFQITRRYPLNPWESGFVVEAERRSHGEAAFGQPAQGNITWFYGPVTLHFIGSVFSITGPNNYAGRLLSLICGVTLFALVATTVNRQQSVACWIVTLCLLLTTHIPSCSYLVDSRPDFPAMLMTYLFLFSFYKGNLTASPAWYLVGLVCILLATFMKQTSAVFSLVPMVAITAHSPMDLRKSWAWLVAPIGVIIFSVAITSAINPRLYEFMFVRPRAYPVSFEPGRWFTLLVAYTPLLFLTRYCISRRKADLAPTPLAAWIVTTFVIAATSGLLVASKRGGNFNAFLPAWISAIAFTGYHLHDIFDWINNRSHKLILRTTRTLLLCSLVLLPTVVNLPATFITAWSLHHGSRAYESWIAQVAKLPGNVACPEDPTIVLYARGKTQRCLVFEMDAAAWRRSPTDQFLDELRKADWVIRVHSDWSRILLRLWLDDRRLKELGFVRVENAAAWGPGYELWRNVESQP